MTRYGQHSMEVSGQGHRMAIAYARKSPLGIRGVLHQGMGILQLEESVLIRTDESGTHQD